MVVPPPWPASAVPFSPAAVRLSDGALLLAAGASFGSFLWQYQGLVGARGIRPALRVLRGAKYFVFGEKERFTLRDAAWLLLQVRAEAAAPPGATCHSQRRALGLTHTSRPRLRRDQCPTVLWVGCSDQCLAGVAVTGAAAAALGLAGVAAPALAAAVCGGAYLSIVVVSEPFYNMQQDAHLVELCFLRAIGGNRFGPAGFVPLARWLAVRHSAMMAASELRHAIRAGGLAQAFCADKGLPEGRLQRAACAFAAAMRLVADAMVVPLGLGLFGDTGRMVAVALQVHSGLLAALQGRATPVSALLTVAHALPLLGARLPALPRVLSHALRMLRLTPSGPAHGASAAAVKASTGIFARIASTIDKIEYPLLCAVYGALSVPGLLRALGVRDWPPLLAALHRAMARLRVVNAYSRPAPRPAPRTEVAFELTYDGSTWLEAVPDRLGVEPDGGVRNDYGPAQSVARALHTPRLQWRMRQLAPPLSAIEKLEGDEPLERIVPPTFWATSMLSRMLESGMPLGSSDVWDLLDAREPLRGVRGVPKGVLRRDRAQRLAHHVASVLLEMPQLLLWSTAQLTGWSAPQRVAQRLRSWLTSEDELATVWHSLRMVKLPVAARALVYAHPTTAAATNDCKAKLKRKLVAAYGQPVYRDAAVRAAIHGPWQ